MVLALSGPRSGKKDRVPEGFLSTVIIDAAEPAENVLSKTASTYATSSLLCERNYQIAPTSLSNLLNSRFDSSTSFLAFILM
jgi:hypothetical protein